MKIGIKREGKNIITVRDYSDIDGSAEIAAFLAELESIKKEVLKLYEKYKNVQKENQL